MPRQWPHTSKPFANLTLSACLTYEAPSQKTETENAGHYSRTNRAEFTGNCVESRYQQIQSSDGRFTQRRLANALNLRSRWSRRFASGVPAVIHCTMRRGAASAI